MADNKDKKRSWWKTAMFASIVSALGFGDGEAVAKNSEKIENHEKGKVENFDNSASVDAIQVSKVEERNTADDRQAQIDRINDIMKKNPADRTLAEYIEAREYYNGKNKHLAKADEKIQILEAQAITTMQNLMERGISDEEMKSVEKFMEVYPKTEKYNTSVKDKFAEYIANITNPKQENSNEVSQDKEYVVGSRLANAIGGFRRSRVSYSRYGVTRTPIRPYLGGVKFSTTRGTVADATVDTGTRAETTAAPEKAEVEKTSAPKKKSWLARLFSKKEDKKVAVENNPQPMKVVIAQPWYQTFKFDSNNPETSFKEWAEKAGRPMTKDKLQMAINSLPSAYREVGSHIRRWTEHAYKKGYNLDWNELPKNYKKELAMANETYAQQLEGTGTRIKDVGAKMRETQNNMRNRRNGLLGGSWNIYGR